jgi:hypothetical protein
MAEDLARQKPAEAAPSANDSERPIFFALAETGKNCQKRGSAAERLTNTWQIDCDFVCFDAARCAFDGGYLLSLVDFRLRGWLPRLDSNQE